MMKNVSKDQTGTKYGPVINRGFKTKYSTKSIFVSPDKIENKNTRSIIVFLLYIECCQIYVKISLLI